MWRWQRRKADGGMYLSSRWWHWSRARIWTLNSTCLAEESFFLPLIMISSKNREELGRKAPEGKLFYLISLSLVQFSCSVVSDSLWPHESQHARLPWPTPTPRVHPNSCLLSQWCHPTISSSVVPFSSCPQSFPASGSFLMSQLFASGGRTIGVSASTSVLPMNIQDWSTLGWTGWISLLSKEFSRVFSNRQSSKA